MHFQVHGAAGRTTIRWASGTSTEIFIHPPGSGFAERDFLFRISTATVEAEESTFTFFKGVTRHLMVLEGQLDLIHEGHYSKTLKPFEQDTFSGEWPTRSKGKVRDFNLMLTGGAEGALVPHRILPGSNKDFQATADFSFLYLVSGKAAISGKSLTEGDLVQLDAGTGLKLQALTVCDVIGIQIFQR